MAILFEVTKQIGSGAEQVRAKFADEKDALDFINAKVAWDHKTRVNSIYRLYEAGEMLHEIDASQYESLERPNGGGSQRSGSMSPLATSPRPVNFPPSSRSGGIDADEEES